MKAIGIRHAAVVASDMEKVLPFYRDLLGMEIWADFIEDSGFVQAVTGAPQSPNAPQTNDHDHISRLEEPEFPNPGPQTCDIKTFNGGRRSRCAPTGRNTVK